MSARRLVIEQIAALLGQDTAWRAVYVQRAWPARRVAPGILLSADAETVEPDDTGTILTRTLSLSIQAAAQRGRDERATEEQLDAMADAIERKLGVRIQVGSGYAWPQLTSVTVTDEDLEDGAGEYVITVLAYSVRYRTAVGAPDVLI